MLKIIIILLTLNGVSHAIVESEIQNVMDTKIHQVLTILKNKALTQVQKEKKSIAVMDDIFDYHTMAKISLGRKWHTLTALEQKKFSKAFENKIKHSYVDKLRLYNNQKVVIKTLKKIKSTRITLETQIIGKTDTYQVVYLFYKNRKKNQWFIYDVRLAGVSIIQTYRKQFASFLKTKSFNTLLSTL
jgi:phospholipid transport system substrate-binding protein